MKPERFKVSSIVGKKKSVGRFIAPLLLGGSLLLAGCAEKSGATSQALNEQLGTVNLEIQAFVDEFTSPTITGTDDLGQNLIDATSTSDYLLITCDSTTLINNTPLTEYRMESENNSSYTRLVPNSQKTRLSQLGIKSMDLKEHSVDRIEAVLNGKTVGHDNNFYDLPAWGFSAQTEKSNLKDGLNDITCNFRVKTGQIFSANTTFTK